jgi:hypothetical protein
VKMSFIVANIIILKAARDGCGQPGDVLAHL